MTTSTDAEKIVDLATIGETMAAFVRVQEPDRYQVVAVGAESNVAAGMAQLGCTTRWVSRLGEDELGRFAASTVERYGVELAVEWDDSRPTGVMIKERSGERTRVRYYRSTSAARRLGPDDTARLGRSRWIHLTGITTALSPSCGRLVQELISRSGGPRVSFDVNYRTALWDGAEEAARVIEPLARAADIVFVGDDEALALFGTRDPDELRQRLLRRDQQELVLKRGGGVASVVTLDGEVDVAPDATEVVELVGAGDAFAAGYLAASLWGAPARRRLELGHVMAGRAMSVLGDIGPTPTSDELRRFRSGVPFQGEA